MRQHLTDPLEEQVTNHHLPGWMRVALWCWANADGHGHARAWPGQLRKELAFITARDVSRAIQLARARNLIDDCSTAYCLVRRGHAIAPCEAPHREVNP